MRALADEDLVLAHVDDDVEISGRATEETAFALIRQTEPVPFLDAGGNPDLEHTLPCLTSLAFALLATMAIDRALAPARGTRARDRQEALREAHLALSATGAAGF